MTDNETLGDIVAPKKLYSQLSIRIATFLGSPLAAGVLIRKNFIALGEEVKGRNALIIGIVSTLLIFAGLFALPEKIIDSIPNFVIPVMYTGIVHVIVTQTQGDAIDKHKTENGEFYSGWRAAGIGLLSTIILLPGIFAYAIYGPQGFNGIEYDRGIEEFTTNEEEALKLYDILETENINEAIDFIQNEGIALWERNVAITQELDNIDGIPSEFIYQNEVLRDYSLLRIESYELIEKALIENTDEYDAQIDQLYIEIDKTLEKL